MKNRRDVLPSPRALAAIVVTVAVLLCAACGAAPEADSAPAEPEQFPLWFGGDDGYHSYRIPSLLTTSKGTLLAFSEARKNDRRDHGNIDLVVKRSTDNGATWSAQSIVYEEGGDAEITIGNPCPVVDQDTGVIWLPFNKDNKEVFITSSTDDGLSWSEPVNISSTVKRDDWAWVAAGPGVGIQLRQGPRKGRLVIPADYGVMSGEERIQHSYVFYSDDHGETWQLGGLLPEHTDESQLVELADGRLLLNMRSYWGRVAKHAGRDGKRALAWSGDGGETWSNLSFDDTLIEPVCQASFLRYTLAATGAETGAETGGRNRLLFSNPASTTDRVKMTVRLSYDEGESWPVSKLLHEGPAAYSSLAVLPDGSIACLYERGQENAYETIHFARFSLDWLSGGSDTPPKQTQ